jgi:hypothetical protein
MSFKPVPANDPNDAYAVIPTPAELHRMNTAAASL